MSGALPARKRLHALVRGGEARVTFPLAFETAAVISARDLEAFACDPTQLANGLTELYRAIDADALLCGRLVDVQAHEPRLAASLEACRRLRASLGDAVVLAAVLPSPDEAASARFIEAVRAFGAAGLDLLLVEASGDPEDQGALKTASNVMKFHRGLALGLGAALPAPSRIPLRAPARAPLGVVTTATFAEEADDIEVLRTWVKTVREASE